MKISKKIWNILMNEWWVRHLCFWIFIALYFTWGTGIHDKSFGKALITGLGYLPGCMIVVYPFLYLLMPKFLYKRKFLLLILSLAGLLACAKGITEWLAFITPKDIMVSQRYGTGRNILPIAMVTAMAAFAKLIKYYFYRSDKADQEEDQRIRTELELLKSQIHPNFLFNTLNNLFAHTIKNSNESPNIVLKLSDLLRFMIYESRCEFIPLDHEVQLLKNYIELEKLRHEKELDVSFISSGELENKMIRPLLLLPLVEYAFKQATAEENELKWISINIHSNQNTLHFNLAFSENRNDHVDDAEKGFNNVVKRLTLLYPEDHMIFLQNHAEMGNITLELSITDIGTLPQNVQLIRKRSYEMEMPVGR
jgi:Histidine kinase